MTIDTPEFWIAFVQIIWIDLILSGDNAVVIALACRSLPPKHRKWGVILGAGAAVGLRIIFALAVTLLLGLPYLKVAGGLLLFWIAVKLLTENGEESHDNIEGSESLWKAVRTVAIADAVMSLDNVVAIAAASRGHPELFIFGLLLSIPLIVAGAQIIMSLIARFPILVWAGAALLGWIAGEMIVSDTAVVQHLAARDPSLVAPATADHGPVPVNVLFYGAAVVGALIVIGAGLIKRRSQEAAEEV